MAPWGCRDRQGPSGALDGCGCRLAVGAAQPDPAAALSRPCAASPAPSGSRCPWLREHPDGTGTCPAPGEKGTVGNHLLSKARDESSVWESSGGQAALTQHSPSKVSDRSASLRGPAPLSILHVLGWLKSFLGNRIDLEVYHTAQPKKPFVLHQEIQPARGSASRMEGSRPPADAD